MPQPSMCVIGAGIAGLVTAKVLKEDGFAVTVFDRDPEIGGVWASFRTYPNLRANNSRITYSFSDFPYPPGTDLFPTASQVRSYLNSYVDHFGLRPLIRLSTLVQRVEPAPSSGYRVTVHQAEAATTEALHFDFVVVCNGVFSDPRLPVIENASQFAGSILHSSQVTGAERLSGKRVMVVGAAKSGLDCAALSADHAAHTVLLFRRAHWMAPRYLPNGLPAEKAFFNRFTAALVEYHRSSRRSALFHRNFGWLINAWWRLQGKLMLLAGNVPSSMIPDTPLPGGLVFAGAGAEFFEAIYAGKVEPRRGIIKRITGPHTVEIESTSPGAPVRSSVDADVIILATGWRQSLDFLSPELAESVRPSSKGGKFRLYRRILPPAFPGLAFNGYSSSLACQLSSELAAHWLSDHFQGRLNLPSPEEMEAEIDRVQAWTSTALPGRDQGFFIGGYLIHYLDELMQDMNLEPKRIRGILGHYFSQIRPDQWKDIPAERKARGAAVRPLT
ncbi:monooxygenase [Bryobacterales bacterium F-183]|nr:monooxygenase [Bryobacterales bacterium F-183]